MSRLKMSIQTARISAHAHCTDRRGSFKRKRIFYAERGIVAWPHILAGQASKKKRLYDRGAPVRKKIQSFPMRKTI
jgi:hypothetical protein